MSKKRKEIQGLYYLSCSPSHHESNFIEEVAKKLRQQGYTVLSPNEINSVATTLPQAQLRLGLRMLTQCHAMVLLPGWELSQQCLLDLSIARAAGHEIYELVLGQNGEAVLLPSTSLEEMASIQDLLTVKS